MKVKECYELEMPTPCEECGEVFDLHDGHRHPSRNIVICAECANRLQQEADREEEIENLKEEIQEAQWTIENARKRLAELGAGMTKDEILKELNEKAVCTIGDNRAIADKSNPGAYKVEYKKDGVWKTFENDLDREDAAELLHQRSNGSL